MALNTDIIETIATQNGLARARLFRAGEAFPQGEHEVLLDGRFGSFAISVSKGIDPLVTGSWSWSSDLPHHVRFDGVNAIVQRWDNPLDPLSVSQAEVISDPNRFFDFLRSDKVTTNENVVAYSLGLFQKIRNVVHHAGGDDQSAISAYLALLALQLTEQYGQSPDFRETIDRAVSRSAVDLLKTLPDRAIESLLSEGAVSIRGQSLLHPVPSLSIRHASGAIFQEAHYELVAGAPPDMFNHIAPATGSATSRGGVHFTPPSLARAVSEQALGTLGDLGSTRSIVIADFACGSAAFLLEFLRALERVGFSGDVKLVGRDVSPVAIEMARFVMQLAAAEWPGLGVCSVDLAVCDTLAETELPSADVVVMNPPFQAWSDMPGETREAVREVLGGDMRGRPDLSMAFVTRAVGALKQHGVLATLLPANVLEADSMTPWRKSIMTGRAATFAATFGNLSIFSHAIVRTGALILSPKLPVTRLVRMSTGSGGEDLSDALRFLRQRNSDGENIVVPSGKFSMSEDTVIDGIFPVEILSRSRPLSEKAFSNGLPALSELFEIQQGIRTGLNAAFVLTPGEVAALPYKERGFFREVITSKGISNGRVKNWSFVFYPYLDGASAFEDESAVSKAVPEYYERFLAPNINTLQTRVRLQRRWWELSERRPGLDTGHPTFVSKYFAGPGGVVIDQTRQAMVLQGFGWIPKGRLKELMAREDNDQLVFAYHAILNSNAFFEVVAENSSALNGGQFDMSPRYLKNMPLVDLSDDETDKVVVKALADLARAINGHPDSVSSDWQRDVEVLVWKLMRTGPFEQDGPATPTDQQPYPEWARAVIEGGLEGVSQAEKVALLRRMQSLARESEFSVVSDFLADAPTGALADSSLITLVRGTFSFRKKIGSWSLFRDRVASELELRGKDTKKAMVGLFE